MLGTVRGKGMKFFVDTGAAISIMSTGVFQSLSDPTLMFFCAANGKCLEVQGMVKLELTIGSLRVEQDIIVANIQVDMILGMDFLGRHGCKVDITAQELTI